MLHLTQPQVSSPGGHRRICWADVGMSTYTHAHAWVVVLSWCWSIGINLYRNPREEGWLGQCNQCLEENLLVLADCDASLKLHWGWTSGEIPAHNTKTQSLLCSHVLGSTSSSTKEKKKAKKKKTLSFNCNIGEFIYIINISPRHLKKKSSAT